jgi:hypothetical protein
MGVRFNDYAALKRANRFFTTPETARST